MVQCGIVASPVHRVSYGLQALSARERVSVVLLASSHRRLVINTAGHLDTQSEKGLEACSRFLRALESTAQALKLEPEPRTYREEFTGNYRALFNDSTRSYRVDILEAGTNLTQHPVIWANGEEYELSGDVMLQSERLRAAWADLCTILEISPSGSPRNAPRFDRSKLVSALSSLDQAWAAFENAYILELMKVQERARGLVAQAVECERRLTLLEQTYPGDQLVEMPSYQAEKRALVACMAQLNSVANFQRKGRDDLGVSILDAAAELLQRSQTGNAPQGSAEVLAKHVIESFEEFRDYLHTIKHHMDLLHPHLCQNPGLVSRLVRWEETWEIGARYVQNDEVFGALCYFLPKLRQAQQDVPALADMCGDCDAELFMVIPRIVLLCLLTDPAKPTELIRRLLPHRFSQPSNTVLGGGASAIQQLTRSCSSPDFTADGCVAPTQRGTCMGNALLAATQKFWHAELLLTRAAHAGGPSAWDILVRRAVSGMGSASDPYSSLPQGQPREAAAAATEGLMHELEGWSMELQRHSPEDWNECVSVLLQCLAGGQATDRREQPREFVV